VAIDFSNKLLIIHPAAFNLGRCIIVLGVLAVIVGVVTSYTGQFFEPPSVWFAAAVPTIGIGGAFVACSMTRP
jgi:hypothetical protein